MKMETEISQRCSLDDSFIPAEEGRKVCQRREEATPTSQRERKDKRNTAVIAKIKKKRESVFRNKRGQGKSRCKESGEIKTDHVDPERPAIYVAQSRTPDSNRAFITPEKPTMARKPPPEPAMAITGTCNTHTEEGKERVIM